MNGPVEGAEARLSRYMRALVATLLRRKKNANELCHLLGVSRDEASTIWERYR